MRWAALMTMAVQDTLNSDILMVLSEVYNKENGISTLP